MSQICELVHELDRFVTMLTDRQITRDDDTRFGGFWTAEFHVEPRQSGFILSRLIIAYITKQSAHYQSAALLQAIDNTLTYMERHQRSDGCFDLSPCNFASPPDTAFMINAVLNAWWLMDSYEAGDLADVKSRLYAVIDKAASGIAAGGFHTPNHRWAISACLLSWAKITGREELKARSQEYLREGLDINEYGEFAERSAGNYNQVNDDQMIRLYMATGDKEFLDAAISNLEMMYAYIDPDDTVFTNNSTRQDMGKKTYMDTYYKLYLTVGYLSGRKDLGAMAQWIWRNCRSRGVYPDGLEWLLLYPEMDGFGADEPFVKPFVSYSKLFPESDIARVRRVNWSYTLLKGKPNLLYFQNGAFSMYMTIYGNLCDKRNIVAQTLEGTEHGYRMTSHAAGWYYLPYAEKPSTSDWWKMDNKNTRPVIEGLPLDTTIEITELQDGIELHMATSGIDQLPLRFELSFLPGGYVRSEHFLQHARAGESINVLDGEIEAMGESGDTICVSPAFGAHDVTERMGGAYPLSQSHYTVYMTAYTPFDRALRITAARKPRELSPESIR